MLDLIENQLSVAKKLFQQKIINGAALIAGNALIEYMLRLGSQYNIPKSIVDHQPGDKNAGDRLNQILLNIGAYDVDMYKQISVWLSIRTESAKNREDYTVREVEQMLGGIEKFAEDFLK
jgi:hypothetical protein